MPTALLLAAPLFAAPPAPPLPRTDAVPDPHALELTVTAESGESLLIDGARLWVAPGRTGRMIVTAPDGRTVEVTATVRPAETMIMEVYDVGDLVAPANGDWVTLEQTADLVRAGTAREMWQEGGGRGLLKANEPTGSLVVRQTRDGHQRVASVLRTIRRIYELRAGE